MDTEERVDKRRMDWESDPRYILHSLASVEMRSCHLRGEGHVTAIAKIIHFR